MLTQLYWLTTNYAGINRSDQNQFRSNWKILAFEAYFRTPTLQFNVPSKEDFRGFINYQ